MTKLSKILKIVILTGLIMALVACSQDPDKKENLPPLNVTKPGLFSLSDVTLLDGPFKTAMDLNVETLLKYNADRLLAPFLKEAGLTAKATSYVSWNAPGIWTSLDGHVGGHHLSALAMTWASTKDSRIKDRMDYMLSELKACQDKNITDAKASATEAGKVLDGYVGGVYSSKTVWQKIKNGNFTGGQGQFNMADGSWVPWYNIHKTYAGLRDAYLHGGSEQALDMFIKLCDWGLTIIEGLSDDQMEKMLETEYGGMNEVYADAYELTGDDKYLDAAIRFSHKLILDPLTEERDDLNGKHANTQVPKVVGYTVVARNTSDSKFINAAKFFWETVVYKRSTSFGGNSVNEWFSGNDAYIRSPEGPETCNTNNMLKLTENLYRDDQLIKYGDFYERALYNHILASQNPQTGGYVYFTPAKPEHYRVYSSTNNNEVGEDGVNSDMWCCVGTGMENHAKYGAFIYGNAGEALYVNLFISSEVKWKNNITITQTTKFPDEEKSSIKVTVDSPKRFALRIRNPWWIGQGGMKVNIDGKNYAAKAKKDSYIEIDRTWKNGDTVEIILPMDIYIERLPDVSNYLAIMRGPILLCAEIPDTTLRYHGDGTRETHRADGAQISVDDTPVVIGTPEEIIAKLKEKGTLNTNEGEIVLKPFFQVHENRYQMYWIAMTESEYAKLSINENESVAPTLNIKPRYAGRW